MDKIWLSSYPEGVPAEIDPDAYTSLNDIFARTCERFRDRPAFSNLGRTITFGELDRLSLSVAAYFSQRLGHRPGDRIAIMLPNLLQYPVVLFGALRAGLAVVNVNPLYTARELAHQLNDSGATTIVALANRAGIVAEAVAESSVRNVIVTEVGDLLPFPRSLLVNLVIKYVKRLVPPYRLPGSLRLKTVLSEGGNLSLPPVTVGGQDIAFLQYTGGTTGVAKGAMLTHRNMIANLEQVSACLRTRINDGRDIVITALPLYHIFCLTANCLIYVKHGGLNVLITDPRDLKRFVADLRRWSFTVISGVNTLFNALLNAPDFEHVDFSALQLTVGGGMTVQAAVAERWKQVTGCPILEGYGLTECSPVVCVNPADKQEIGSIGLPVPSTDVDLRDDAGATVPLGEPGELCVKGPQVMLGYWQRPEETQGSFTADGWLRTGDIATVDERGFFRIVDRKKDMILVSGFNVFPNEIENVLALHEGILECACVGVQDPKSGEAVKVFLVAKPGAHLTAAEIKSHCKAHLTGYKVPRFVEFRDELPKSSVGKILRRELR